MTQYIWKECCDSTTGFERTISSLWCVSNSNQMYWCGHARKKNYLDRSSTACKLLMTCFGVSGRKSHSINAEVDFWATLETILAIWASDIQIVLVSVRFHSLNTVPPPSPITWNVPPYPYVYVKIIFCQKESLQVLFPWKWKIHSSKRASNLRLLLARTGLTLALSSGRALKFNFESMFFFFNKDYYEKYSKGGMTKLEESYSWNKKMLIDNQKKQSQVDFFENSSNSNVLHVMTTCQMIDVKLYQSFDIVPKISFRQ